MGFPAQSLVHRMDNKIYKLQVCSASHIATLGCCLVLQTPQSPMVRPYLYDQYSVDDYPLGTNAVVAVISYTVSRHTASCCSVSEVYPAQGYDMEDAMILNKASFERGFAHASVYKCEVGCLILFASYRY